MNVDTIRCTAPLRQWQGETSTGKVASWYLVDLDEAANEALAAHAAMRKLETGKRNGFGSVKVIARIGETEWRTSAFPSRGEWIVFIKKSVRVAEDIALGDDVQLELELL